MVWGGGNQCEPIKDRVVNSVLYLMELQEGSRNENFGKLGASNFGRYCLGAKVSKIKRGAQNLVSTKPKSGKVQWKKGIESLIGMAIDKLEAKKGSSVWGGDKWGSSWVGANGSSLYLTGVGNAGEYLVWKEEFQKDIQKSNGKVLVALKEKSSNDEKIFLKIGWKEWTKTDSSPQLQIEKENIQDWRVSVEFGKFDSSKK